MNPVVRQKIADFEEQGVPEVFERDLDLGAPHVPARGNLVTLVTGVRRCGKTYRLFQEMNHIGQMHPRVPILYFNFEDERLKPFEASLLSEVLDTFYAIHPEAKEMGAYLFFDEIQEVPEWGMFLRRLVDTEKVTIYVTGSSSRMLSADMATEFRGRSLTREIWPMSWSEYLRFHDVVDARGLSRASALSSATAAKLRNALPGYLTRGGFIDPQRLGTQDAIQLQQEYAFRTVNMDVIERYGLKTPVVATQFLSRCLASSGCELSINKAAEQLKQAGVRTSRTTLSNLLSYYEESYLLFSVGELSRSLSENPRAVSKVYDVDPGMLVAFSPAGVVDEGQRLETAVFNQLRRERGGLRQGAIARLLVREGGKQNEVVFARGDPLMGDAYELVQVSVSLEEAKTRKRELGGLQAAMRQKGLPEGWVVTTGESEELDVPEGRIHVVPAWRWLLGE